MYKLRATVASLALVAGLGWWLALRALDANEQRAGQLQAARLPAAGEAARRWLDLEEAEAIARAELLAAGLSVERHLLLAAGGEQPLSLPSADPLPAPLSELPARPGEELALVDASGVVVARARGGAGDSLLHLPPLAAALRVGRTRTGSAAHGPDWVEVVAAPVRSPAGTALGAIVVSRAWSAERAQQLAIRLGAAVAFTVPGRLLGSSLQDEQRAALSASLVAAGPEVDGGAARVFAAPGADPWRALALPLADPAEAPAGGPRLWLLEPASEAAAGPAVAALPALPRSTVEVLSAPSTPWAWGLLGGALLGALILPWWLARSIERPCRRLAHDLRARARGAARDPLRPHRYPPRLRPLVLQLQLLDLGATDVSPEPPPAAAEPSTEELSPH